MAINKKIFAFVAAALVALLVLLLWNDKKPESGGTTDLPEKQEPMGEVKPPIQINLQSESAAELKQKLMHLRNENKNSEPAQ